MPIKLKIYFVLGSLFCVSLVTGNLIFQKFVTLTISITHFELSVGAILYPVTFLLTDLISEFYDKEYADTVVKTGIIASILIMGIIHLSSILPATTWSNVQDNTFTQVFGNYNAGFIASILAAAIAQLVDIRLFKFLKKLTNGRYLWLRNNASTILSQTIDTGTVLCLLAYFEIFPWQQIPTLFTNTILFKYMFALADTPLFYLGTHIIRKLSKKEA